MVVDGMLLRLGEDLRSRLAMAFLCATGGALDARMLPGSSNPYLYRLFEAECSNVGSLGLWESLTSEGLAPLLSSADVVLGKGCSPIILGPGWSGCSLSNRSKVDPMVPSIG